MNIIWKLPLEIVEKQEIELPAGAEILTLQVQNEILCLWVLVDAAISPETRKIVMRPTGLADAGPSGKYIGTCQLPGDFVIHVFDVTQEAASDE